MGSAVTAISAEIFTLFIQMAPYLLFGFIVSGLLYVLIPRTLIIKHLKPNKTSSIFKAAILGVPLPLCSCGVIPVAAHLRKQGANKSATVSFLASTPSTGADSIFATYALMGPIYAVFRPIDALFSGFLAGMLVKFFDKTEGCKSKVSLGRGVQYSSFQVAAKTSLLSMPPVIQENSSCCATTVVDNETINSCCSSKSIDKVEAESSCCSSISVDKVEDVSACCTSDKSAQSAPLGFVKKIQKAVHYGLFELVDDTKKWILIGIVMGGILSWGIPSQLGEYWMDYPVLSYLSMLMIGLPMYVCATASIPIATALLINGLSPGAALVFLAVGPATNTATIAFLSASVGKKYMFIYLFSISFSAILLGIIIDIFYGESISSYFQASEHISHLGVTDYVFSAILAGLILFQYLKRNTK